MTEFFKNAYETGFRDGMEERFVSGNTNRKTLSDSFYFYMKGNEAGKNQKLLNEIVPDSKVLDLDGEEFIEYYKNFLEGIDTPELRDKIRTLVLHEKYHEICKEHHLRHSWELECMYDEVMVGTKTIRKDRELDRDIEQEQTEWLTSRWSFEGVEMEDTKEKVQNIHDLSIWGDEDDELNEHWNKIDIGYKEPKRLKGPNIYYGSAIEA